MKIVNVRKSSPLKNAYLRKRQFPTVTQPEETTGYGRDKEKYQFVN
jgi:hypothetical protein